MKRRLLTLAACLLALPCAGRAHELRNYIDTQEYRKVDERHAELQFHTELRDPDRGDEYFAHETGIEYGASDLYTVGVFGVLTEGRGFSAARLLNRFRLSEPGAWPVDTSVQLEIKDANDHKDQDKIEGMVILSRDMDQLDFTANLILQLNREARANGDDEWDSDPALALAAMYRNGGRIAPGIELFIADDQSRIVPGVYVPLAPYLRLSVGLGFGLESKADDFQLKSLVSWEFAN